MFFCPNCDNSFDITRTLPTQPLPSSGPVSAPQQGGANLSAPDDTDELSSLSASSLSESKNKQNKKQAARDKKKNEKGSEGDDDIEKLLDKATNGIVTKNDLEGIDINKLMKDPSYKKLPSKQKEFIFNKVNDLIGNKLESQLLASDDVKNANIAYFICKNCGYNEQIKEGTLIFSKSTTDSQEYVEVANKDLVNDATLPLTRNYKCPNKDCKSHANHALREAVFFRSGNSYNIRTICKSCLASWTT